MLDKLKTCLHDTIQETAALAVEECGLSCSADRLKQISAATLSPEQCTEVVRTCQVYLDGETDQQEECVRELSGGLCVVSQEDNPGNVTACRSNFAQNQEACRNATAECTRVYEHEQLQHQLDQSITPEEKQYLLQQLQEGQEQYDVAARTLSASLCETGICVDGGKHVDTLCSDYSQRDCGSNAPCKWSSGLCIYDDSVKYACQNFSEEQCTRYNCTWNPRLCSAMSKDSSRCRLNGRKQDCHAPDCAWDPQKPTTHSFTPDLACITTARESPGGGGRGCRVPAARA